MRQENRDILLNLIKQHQDLGISKQIDFEKFYLYSIITHSTAIEGSTVTEVEAQLLFDEGITSSKRTMIEQQMNLDLKSAYDYGRKWIMSHQPITTDWLIGLAAKVMAQTGSEYNSLGGTPSRLAAFCEQLNERRKSIDSNDIAAIYDLSFWAHFEMVTIHPWADGNGRTCRLLMNLLQWEFGVLPTKVLKEDKSEYIQALIDAGEQEDINVFLDCMARLHIQHLQSDIDQFMNSCEEKMVDKQGLRQKMVDKWSIKPSLADKLVDILVYLSDKETTTTDDIVNRFGFPSTTAKRYLRQLTEYGYLVAHGGNRNRYYSKKK